MPRANETHKPVFMVWQVEKDKHPILRAICTQRKIAERYLELPKRGGEPGEWYIEKNLTNHLYGHNDYEALQIVWRGRKHEGD